jgi:glycerol-3-phosphate dehydrogenase (NAD(P)+)
MFKRITIIGDGAMGSVCAMLLCEKSLDVTMWGHDSKYLMSMAKSRENTVFLPGHKLPDSLIFEPDGAKAMCGADLIVSAVPCQFVRSVFERLKPCVPPGVPIASVTKGFEKNTLLRPTQILHDVLQDDRGYAALSGPTIADELADGKPATACAASNDEELAKEVQDIFHTSLFRVYSNYDLLGVELSGATKNVIAIAAGIIDGLGAGDNAKAALLTRGLAEIKRLGVAMGAKDSTFSGLSCLGDLVTTCISPMGRNRSFGERIGKGQTAEQALAATESVVEGVATCESVLKLANEYDVEMPLTQAVVAVISGTKSLQDAMHDLMCRKLKTE